MMLWERVSEKKKKPWIYGIILEEDPHPSPPAVALIDVR